MPRVSVLMPLFNGKRFIRESLESVQKQTFTDWEFIIVNDYGSNDGCAEIVRKYAEEDSRIILVQTEERLGLAASLNLGLDMARGEYVARVDVDDPSEPERLEKQVVYMDAHPEVSLCSVWQRSITPQGSYVQEAAFEADELKAAMLFGCEISHCGAMLRKADFDTHGWRYDPSYLGEDYELWTKMLMEGAVITNIPEVLVSHRWGFENISITKGESLREEVRTLSARIIETLGVQTGRYHQTLFSGWRARPEAFAKKNTALFLQQGYCLLQEIWEKNACAGYCSPDALKKTLFYRWNWTRQSCGIKFENYRYEQFSGITTTPVVSVVLPTFCSAADISRAIDCVQAQTYTDWELLAINDQGSDDGTAEIVQMYAWNDPRIRLIQADRRLGLAESLNLGMREARGKYIARLDADDTSKPERFAKQVEFLEVHEEVGVCGTWQHHYGKNIDFVHHAAPDPKVQRCRLLFWCDLCHSTLMLRRDIFINNQLFYDPDACAEDHELWTRAMEFTQIANIPEVLGEYREGTGITSNKIQQLAEESGRITARTIKRILGVDLPVYDCYLLNGWVNPISGGANRERELSRLKEIFTMIWERNLSVKFFAPQVLLQTLAAKWHWAKDNVDYARFEYPVRRIKDVFDDRYKPSLPARYRVFRQNNPEFSVRFKKLLKRILRVPARFMRRVMKNLLRDCMEEINHGVERWTWDRYQRMQNVLVPQINKSIERWTWDRFQRTDQSLKQSLWTHYTPYYRDSKIRVVFLFQVASFWPGQESLYRSLSGDERFDVKLVCYDEPYDRTIKTETSRKYLENEGYDFVPWELFNLSDFNPHIVFLQTPYDSNRRSDYKSLNLFFQGIRVIYIPYGIEISDTEHAHKDHFRNYVVANMWKIYTFSEAIRQEYLRYLRRERDVCALGLPRFDALYHRERFQQLKEVEQRADGRKIVLWKVHFPKVIKEKGETILITPYIREYIAFAKKICEYQDLFFVFMPHPRFKEFNEDPIVKQELAQLYALLLGAENVYIDDRDDYRNSLLNADCIIVDRSAVMVEAGCVGVPVLYMYNPDNNEPMTAAIKPLIDSYYQGTSCADMESFLAMCRENEDPLKERRQAAFAECIPYFDGKCGERIKEDIIKTLNQERESSIQAQLAQQNAQLEERISRLEQGLQTYISQESTHSREQVLQACEQRDQTIASQLDKSVEHWTWDRFQRTDKQIERWTWDRYRRTQEQIYSLLFDLDRERMQRVINQSPTYDMAFYLDNRFGSIHSAQRVLNVVLKWLPHRSVVDFGCGTGTWLWVAQAFGAQEILGIDGDYVPRPMLMIPEDCFLAKDLEQPVILTKRFDLAMSLEVAEHLSPEAADSFVSSLCGGSDIILFSAAHPGQGGDGHINEQPITYWIEKFAAHNYKEIEIRKYFQNESEIKSWYRENMILFVHQSRYEEISTQISSTEL